MQESEIFGKFFNQSTGKMMKFALIGASKTGTSIAYHLQKNGHQPIFLWNRSKENLAKSNEYVNFENTSTSMENFPVNCDFIIISVRDDAVKTIADQFLKKWKNQTAKIFHTSGALDSSIFGDYQNSGSFHPVISISSIEEGIDIIPQTTFTCEGNIAEFLVQLAEEISESGIQLSKEQKQNIHLSAVFMNNYLAAMIEKIKILNKNAELDECSTEKILQSIAQQTITKSWKNPIEETLTGPIKRGDVKTIQKHLNILQNDNLFQQLYKNFGNILLKFVNNDNDKLLAELLKTCEK